MAVNQVQSTNVDARVEELFRDISAAPTQTRAEEPSEAGRDGYVQGGNAFDKFRAQPGAGMARFFRTQATESRAEALVRSLQQESPEVQGALLARILEEVREQEA